MLSSRFVHAFDVPGNRYRRPLLLSADRIETLLIARMECHDELVHEDELARLIREQTEDIESEGRGTP